MNLAELMSIVLQAARAQNKKKKTRLKAAENSWKIKWKPRFFHNYLKQAEMIQTMPLEMS